MDKRNRKSVPEQRNIPDHVGRALLLAAKCLAVAGDRRWRTDTLTGELTSERRSSVTICTCFRFSARQNVQEVGMC
jgi:hypothetical protein